MADLDPIPPTTTRLTVRRSGRGVCASALARAYCEARLDMEAGEAPTRPLQEIERGAGYVSSAPGRVRELYERVAMVRATPGAWDQSTDEIDRLEARLMQIYSRLEELYLWRSALDVVARWDRKRQSL